MRNRHHKEGKQSGKLWIYGKHSAIAAIDNPERQISRVLVTKNTQSELADRLPKNIELVEGRQIISILGKDAVHQGIAVEVSDLQELDLHEAELGNLVVLLDQITDPHNVGAILRSASAFGAAAVITTERNSAQEGSIMAKAASGGLEYVKYIRVGNLSEAMLYLKKQGFWLIGFDGGSKHDISEIKGYDKLALVMGAEGKGMRHKTREYCDLLVKIPMSEIQESLNVSNAAAIALWEASKRG